MHSTTYYFIVVILVTRRLKGYIVDLGKYVISRRMRFRPYKVYIFFSFFLMKFLCDIAIAYIYKNQSIWRKVSHDVVVNQ